jgi:hypothetical protein
VRIRLYDFGSIAAAQAKPYSYSRDLTAMDTNVWRRLRQQLPVSLEGGTSGKLVAALVVLIVPGGLMLPLCYAAYAAVANAAARRSAGARVEGRHRAPGSSLSASRASSPSGDR